MTSFTQKLGLNWN